MNKDFEETRLHTKLKKIKQKERNTDINAVLLWGY